MKISNKVLEQYQIICPYSSMKCSSFEEIRYKIRRAVSVGMFYGIKGDSTIIRYYDLNFIVKGNVVLDMVRDNTLRIVNINEKSKMNYDRIHMKLVV